MSLAPSPLAPVRSSRALSLGCAIPFGLLFAVVGCVAFHFVTLRPALLALASLSWRETPCEILSSKLTVNTGSDSTTYHIDVRYRYEWAGQFYFSERYGVATGSTNVGVARLRQAVAALPPGQRTRCYVDPTDPSSAVLSRELPAAAWFGALTLLFPAFGIVFMVTAWRSTRTPAAAQTSAAAQAGGYTVLQNSPDPETPGEVALQPASGRLASFIGLTLFALFWNGIVSVFLYNIFDDFGGVFSWIGAIFLVPFVGIGLLMLGLTVQAFSRLFAPPIEVRLDPSLCRLGASVPFYWQLGGSGVQRLLVRLVAHEEATYQQGTSTTTDRSDFYRSTVFDSTDALALTGGRAEINFPDADVVPSFAGKTNRIIWELIFEGSVRWRADVNDRFVLPVRAPKRVPGPSAVSEPRAFTGGGVTLWTVEHFAPAETLVFTVRRDATAARGPLTTQLGWFTEGKGTRDIGIVWSDYLPDLAPGADRSFEVNLPEAPWSFAGQLVAIEWRLEVLDEKRTPLVAAPLVVAPHGQIAPLVALPKESPLSKWKALRAFRT